MVADLCSVADNSDCLSRHPSGGWVNVPTCDGSGCEQQSGVRQEGPYETAEMES